MYLGIDIGTTSICAVVIDQSGAVVFTRTKAEEAAFGAALLAAEKTENKRLSSFIKYE